MDVAQAVPPRLFVREAERGLPQALRRLAHDHHRQRLFVNNSSCWEADLVASPEAHAYREGQPLSAWITEHVCLAEPACRSVRSL